MSRLVFCHTVLHQIIASAGGDNNGDNSVDNDGDNNGDNDTDSAPITIKLLLSIDWRQLASMDDIVYLYTQLRSIPTASILAGLDIFGDPRAGNLRTVVDKLTKLIEEGVKAAVNLAETGAVLPGHGPACMHLVYGESLYMRLHQPSNPNI